MTAPARATAVHGCGNCQKSTAVIDGWAYDYEPDAFTPSRRIHTCGESDRRRR